MARSQLAMSTELLWAAQAGDLTAMRRLLREGADPNRRFMVSGCTCIHEAILRKNHDMARLLIEFGADLDHDDNANWQTPIMSAIIMKDVEMLSLLIKNGATLDAVADDGFTYPDYAREIGRDLIAEFIESQLASGG